MKTKNILLTMLMLALVVPAQAQLNLNKLGKQVKKAAEKKVEQTVGEKKSEATQTVVEETVEKSTETSSVLNKETVGSGATLDEGTPDAYLGVPIGQNVYDHYAKLDGSIYHMWGEALSHYWYKSAEESLDWLRMEQWIFLNALEAAKDGIPMAFKDQGGRHVYIGEMGINAYFALFSARPEVAYQLFATGRAYLKEIANGNINDDIKNIDVVIASIRNKDGAIDHYGPSPYRQFGYGLQDGHIADLFDKYKGKRAERWKIEEERLMEVYRKNVSYDHVKNAALGLLSFMNGAIKEEMWTTLAFNSYLFDIVIDDLKNHPDKRDDQEYSFIVESHKKWKDNDYSKWRGESQKFWRSLYSENESYFKGTVSIPKAAISNPKLEAEMIEIAKTIYDDGRVPVKAIIKNPDWDFDRNALGQIINRFQTAFIIYRMTDGTYRMVDIGFKQMYSGGTYGKTQSRGIGMVNQVVEYSE